MVNPIRTSQEWARLWSALLQPQLETLLYSSGSKDDSAPKLPKQRGDGAPGLLTEHDSKATGRVVERALPTGTKQASPSRQGTLQAAETSER